jgi:hypothetical protein
MKHTLVQHSGYGYGLKPDFLTAVESRTIMCDNDERKVTAAGGILLEGWTATNKAEQQVNYPPESGSGFYLIPRARGSFSTASIDQLRIYIPTDMERGRLGTDKLSYDDLYNALVDSWAEDIRRWALDSDPAELVAFISEHVLVRDKLSYDDLVEQYGNNTPDEDDEEDDIDVNEEEA